MPESRHGVHAKNQTAFRLPEGLLAWLKEQAGREGGEVTMTAIAVRALERERERCEGITTSPPAGAVSPQAVHGIEIITDERMPPGTAALVSRGRDEVSVSAFSLGASEPEPEQAVRSRAKPGCPHRLPPGTTYCKTCDRAK